ncbi:MULTISPECIES: immunity protein SdpI [Bacillus]|uniref:immunity protein SdpI n=1 Tax=Bacillus TaxID=1386 RepID=UPI0022813F6B|nr:immunity protein SdpI [Bacillus inaquosorum]MCY8137410.1 immunity protein SdpI [Bacillus inaquosorum]MCY8276622.1 immunity protein SdpI [Bacillus inaquosorum]MCY8282371.1 immunity protein SdpI [Bacillus inaquosorum]MCY8388203.1 immunity protein SdpI [Bacillus inaquosorum]MCY8728596.1 immunity protein SdpI [Bacillus inaquosorum]
MKKNIISIIIVCLSFLTSIIFYQYLPEEIPIQWSGNKPAAFISKPLTLFIIPVVMLIYYLTFYMLTIKSTQKNKALLFLASNNMLILLYILQLSTLLISLGYELDIDLIIGLAVGIFLIIGGNSMQLAEQNHLIGLRTPWTLKDETVWKLGNRFASKVLVACGFIIAILSFFTGEYIIIIMIVLVLLALVISTVASYLYYKKLNGSR